jgi:hypothetical protein
MLAAARVRWTNLTPKYMCFASAEKRPESEALVDEKSDFLLWAEPCPVTAR